MSEPRPPLDPAARDVNVLEAIGFGPDSERVCGPINLIAVDAHSDIQAPMLRDPTGLPGFSCERWIRLRFTGRGETVSNVRFWLPNLNPNEGWSLRYGVTTTYSKPVNSPSIWAILPVPTTDPGPAHPNVCATLNGLYSPWIVLQALRALPVDAPFQADEFNFRFAYDES